MFKGHNRARLEYYSGSTEASAAGGRIGGQDVGRSSPESVRADGAQQAVDQQPDGRAEPAGSGVRSGGDRHVAAGSEPLHSLPREWESWDDDDEVDSGAGGVDGAAALQHGEVSHMPRGRRLTISIKTTWGDCNYGEG